ncbi:hypothetical protein EXM22_07670 [Oceanispirochaeta crateris]|uniref:Uncharacterized protein n=1 Tax=Oceanispirochaeta crateris TaxID=2518645 RepID=A0A5C1QIA5_9SPIO|nr:hypothetical protein [Oceanispirochaeta crateris]QEN07873.1 hypothetical protein EXM22_07670 [Oceanispirochaeta crateris]
MNKNSKNILPLSIGGGAGLFSILTGVISGVSPGMLLIRGFFSGAFASGFVFITAWLIKTYLPELVQISENKPSGENQDETMGNRVNIVMQDDLHEPTANVQNQSKLTSLSENGPSEGQDLNEIAESQENVHNNKPEDSDIGIDGSDGLDTLPNLDSLEISMGNSSEEMHSSDNFESAESEPVGNIRPGAFEPGDHGDPSDIAKAVKTVLARDKQK